MSSSVRKGSLTRDTSVDLHRDAPSRLSSPDRSVSDSVTCVGVKCCPSHARCSVTRDFATTPLRSPVQHSNTNFTRLLSPPPSARMSLTHAYWTWTRGARTGECR